MSERERKRDVQREGERGQLSILKHDFSEDTVQLLVVIIGEQPRGDRRRERETQREGA